VEQLRPKGSRIVVVNRQDTVPELFKKLVDSNILSAPVINKDGKFYGFVDQHDIVVHVSNLFSDLNGTNLTDVEKLFEAESTFCKSTVAQIAKYPVRKENPNHPVHAGSSLFVAWELLASTPDGIHRIPVINDQQVIVDVVTQSMLIDFLWQNLERIGIVADTKVQSIHGSTPVLTVQENTKAIVAFRQMASSGVYGLAVLDKDGKLVDNISIRDLKGIHPDAKIFWRLWNTVKVFKEKALADFPPPTKIEGPIYVKAGDKLRDVVEKMALNHIHRIYVVDDNMSPQRVISQSDILREVLRWFRATGPS